MDENGSKVDHFIVNAAARIEVSERFRLELTRHRQLATIAKPMGYFQLLYRFIASGAANLPNMESLFFVVVFHIESRCAELNVRR